MYCEDLLPNSAPPPPSIRWHQDVSEELLFRLKTRKAFPCSTNTAWKTFLRKSRTYVSVNFGTDFYSNRACLLTKSVASLAFIYEFQILNPPPTILLNVSSVPTGTVHCYNCPKPHGKKAFLYKYSFYKAIEQSLMSLVCGWVPGWVAPATRISRAFHSRVQGG